MKTWMFLLPVLTLQSGCASSEEYIRYLESQENIAIAKSRAEAARYNAMAEIAKSGDTAVKVSAMMALQENSRSTQQINVAPPKSFIENVASLAPIISPFLHLGTTWYQVKGQMRASDNAMQLGIAQSNNSAALGISTNQAFTGISSAGFKSLESTAGQIQAPVTVVPQANVTTTTLSGTGVIGNGTYSTASNTSLTGTGVLGGGSYSYNPNTITNNNDDHTYTNSQTVK